MSRHTPDAWIERNADDPDDIYAEHGEPEDDYRCSACDNHMDRGDRELCDGCALAGTLGLTRTEDAEMRFVQYERNETK